MKSLKIRLILAVLLVAFISISSATLVGINAIQRQALSNAEHEVSLVRRVLTRNLAMWVEMNKQQLNAFANTFDESKDLDQMLEQKMRAGNFIASYIAFDDGLLRDYPLSEDGWGDDFVASSRPWHILASANPGRTVLTRPYLDSNPDVGMVVTFAHRMRNAVVAADVRLATMADAVVGADMGDLGYVMLLDGEDQVLIYPPTRSALFAMSDLSPDLTPGLVRQNLDNDQLLPMTIADSASLVGFASIPGSDWQLAFVVDRAELMRPVYSLLQSMIMIAVLILALIALAAAYAVKLLLQPLNTLETAMQDVSQGEGDLTRQLTYLEDNELGRISAAFNQFLSQVHDLVVEAKGSARHLAQTAKVSAEITVENQQQISRQQDEISQVAAAIHEMSATASEVASGANEAAESARSATQASEQASGKARDNGSSMNQLANEIGATAKVIDELNQDAQKINYILNTIQDIAEQTNLLALNAAIEAARAGDHGRGFAVVADEVRALSQRTHEATGEIQKMIESLQGRTGQAVSMMEQSVDVAQGTIENAKAVQESLGQINQAIASIDAMSQRIASAASEQNVATNEISQITTVIKDAAEQLAHSFEETQQQVQQTTDLSHGIEQNLKRFHTR